MHSWKLIVEIKNIRKIKKNYLTTTRYYFLEKFENPRGTRGENDRVIGR